MPRFQFSLAGVFPNHRKAISVPPEPGGTEDKFGEACVNLNQRRRVPNNTGLAEGAVASGWLGEPPPFPPAAHQALPLVLRPVLAR